MAAKHRVDGCRTHRRLRRAAARVIGVIAAGLAGLTEVAALDEATPGATIQRHGIPSGTPTPTPPLPTPTPIPCDCDGNLRVAIHELVQGVRLALGDESSDACGGMDGNRDGRLTVDELVVGVLHALYGCAAFAVPDAVFGANVFFGPAVIRYGPAVVRENLAGTLTISIQYGLAQSVHVSGQVGAEGHFALSGQRADNDLDVVCRLTGQGELEVIAETMLLHAYLRDRDGEPVNLRLVREMQGTPTAWSGAYDVVLVREGEELTSPLTMHVPASGLAQCEGPDASGADAQGLRSGACQIAPSGGFHFETRLADGPEIILLGLLDDAHGNVTGHGTWGELGTRGGVTGTWTAARRPDRGH
jgi:hypothetical protein